MPIPSMEPLIALFRVAWALCGPGPKEEPLGREAYPAADRRYWRGKEGKGQEGKREKGEGIIWAEEGGENTWPSNNNKP